MHRSGTSATTGSLRCLGVRLGRKLYRGHAGINEKGYFEHGDIADANEEALLEIGSSWDDILLKPDGWWKNEALAHYARQISSFIQRDFSGTELWALKDPRVCRLLPWWLQILEREQIAPVFMFVVRSPEEVYRSLEKRDGFTKDKAFLLWALHYLDAERWTRGFQRVFVSFDRMLHTPVEELQKVESELGVSFPVAPDAAHRCLHEFLSPSLRHFTGESEASSAYPAEQLAWDLFRVLVRDDGAQGANADMDLLNRRMEDIQSEFPSALVAHLRDVARQRGKSAIMVAKVMRSWSWYIGKPIRLVERLFMRDV